MDLVTLMGVITGILLLGGAIILGGNPLIFISFSSIMIVMGGTLAGTLVKHSFKQLSNIPQLIKIAFRKKTMHEETEIINVLVELATKARREGLLALEEESQGLKDAFLRKGIELVIDGTEPELVRSIMETKLTFLEERHAEGQGVFETMGQLAPAFGMIGTLIGLIQMLSVLDDPSQLGGGMAVALITTLYGAMAANLFFIPLAGKLETKSQQEILVREVMIEGILSIQAGENPHIIEEKLLAFLATEHTNNEEKNEEEE
ncbi:MAG: motility protein A [bacterium]